MARTNRVRLSDREKELLDEAAAVRYGDETAEEIPYGRVIAELSQAEIRRQGGDE